MSNQQLENLPTVATPALADFMYLVQVNVSYKATVEQFLNLIDDLTGADIKALYEVEPSAFTDGQFTKLGAIEPLADVTDTDNVRASITSILGGGNRFVATNNAGAELIVSVADNILLGRDASTGDVDIQGLTATEVRSLINVANNAEENPEVVSQGDAEAGTSTAERTWTAERVKQAIAALESPGGVESGTVMVFYQAAAPTGWSEVVTHNDKAIRIVSGAGGGNGGTVAFETAFASQAVSGTNTGHAITIAQMPVHSHGIKKQAGAVSSSNTSAHFSNGTPVLTGTGTENAGSGNTHTHTFSGTAIDLDVSYINCKLADKD